MKKKNLNSPDPGQLKFENELKKMELSLKTGAQFRIMDENIPPEVEKQFLKNLERIENAYQTAKQITIFEKIGKPELINHELLTDREVSEALKSLHESLIKNGISLDSICPVDDRTLYNFITNEFIKTEILDMRFPGFMACYIYEEYYPNHEYDVKKLVGDVVKQILEISPVHFDSPDLRYIENNPQLQLFVKSFEKFTRHHFNISQVELKDDKGLVHFEIKFTGHIEGNSGKVIFNCKGIAQVYYTGSYWWIKRLELPV